MIDVSGLVPEAQPIAERAAIVYIHHAGRDFRGLIAHGSAVKGGVIPNCSDIDLQLYLDGRAFDAAGHLPLDRQIALHRDLARIDPAPFHYIQCYAIGTRLRDGWTGPIPGAYRILAGHLPIPEATEEQLRRSAAVRLAALDPWPAYLKDSLLDHGRGRLERNVRLLCTEVWPALYELLILGGEDAIPTWNLTKQAAMARLPADSPAATAIRGFHAAVCAYFADVTSIADALDAITHGIAFLTAAKQAVARDGSGTLRH
ncbi:MAG TPA: hypothetical protein VEZ14_13490 [Dehalococcoidia bacterium]|nr:hypothetical protein [Dehalococcoidia bacterium]